MKKITKLNLDELAEMYPVLTKEEQGLYWGGYRDDCFWRCLAYIKSGGQYYTVEQAEIYARDYYCSVNGWTYEKADRYLTRRGAGMSATGIADYVAWAQRSGLYDLSDASGIYYIACVFTSDLTGYEAGDFHAVVITGKNADGSLNYFDPQLGQGIEGVIEADKVDRVRRAMY